VNNAEIMDKMITFSFVGVCQQFSVC